MKNLIKVTIIFEKSDFINYSACFVINAPLDKGIFLRLYKAMNKADIKISKVKNISFETIEQK